MALLESLETRQHFSFGAPLANFGITGHVTAPTIGNSDSGFGHSETQSDGKIFAGVGGGLTRYTRSGVVDTSFGTNGIVGFRGFSFRDFAIDSTGRIDVLASGTSGTFVLRYTAAGALDGTFGSGGTALVESSKTFRAAAIDIQSDGKIVVAGSRQDDSTGSTARVYRLSAGGGIDSGFGSSGSTTIALGTGNLVAPQLGDTVVDIRALSSGKIEILGSSYNYDPSGTDSDGNYEDAVQGSSYLAVARLTSSGSADSSFGSGGVVRRAVFDNELDQSNAGVIRADGSAVVTLNNDDQAAFVGFASNGAISYRTYDPSFANVSNAVDATALSDGRVAFVELNGGVFTVSSSGVASNVVTPLATSDRTSNAIVATSDDDLITTTINSGGLTASGIDGGKATDARAGNFSGALAIDTAEDSNGVLHVAYFDTATKTLKYTYRTAAGLWGRLTTVDATAGAGANLSIAATSSGSKTAVAIAYYDAATADLRVAAATNFKRFTIQTVASKGATGLSPSLQFTDSGGLAVSFYNKSTNALYYALSGGGKWSTEYVDAGGAWNDLEFDPNSRRPAIAYSSSRNTVKYALKSKAGWASTVAATTTSGAGFINLALPAYVTYYGPVISYYDLSTADLVLLHYDRNAAAAKRWSKTTLASRGAVGAYNQLFTDYYGNATVYTWNRNSDAVLKITDETGTITTSVVATGGGRFLSATGIGTTTTGATDANVLAYLDTATGDVFVR